ncbi:MAG: segregation/condensation protein A, partial [Fibrobacter sp.]|nr:segregation/condensation protein A [Fibrobacter sp.]
EMLEYQRFKQVASGLQEMEAKNFGTYSRGRLEKTQNDDDTLADANIWQLFRAYQKSLKTKISETIHHIELDYVTIQDRQQAINNFLNAHGRALFEDLLDNDSHPIVAAVTFMAMLEMIKTDDIVFRQSELFGPIWIYRKKNNPEYADEMAHETVFFSKDPEVKAGLVETIRSQAIARSKEKSVGDLAATMREAVLWTERGRNVTEEDLNAMLEGREDISEVQENPFADMIAEADAAEGAQQAASTPAGDTPQSATPESAETAPNQDVASANDNVATSIDSASVSATEDAAIPTIQASTDASAETSEAPDGTSVLADMNKPSHIIEPSSNISDIEETAHTFEPVDELGESAIEQETAEVADIESEAADFESADDSIDEPTIVAGNINSVQGLSEDAVKQMSDEEFAAFVQKAQAFYDNASSAQPSTNKKLSSANETPSSTAFAQHSSDISENDDVPFITKSHLSDFASNNVSTSNDEPEEDKYSSYSFGNEMTDEEYIAYLNRSARASRKEESKSAASPEKPKKKSFMPEDDEGGMTDEEYQAYLAEHGDDGEDEEGPVVYGAGKD